ncbi:hypothetical protein MHU86_24014 [Fragilaria crotonensis]|nr:hypothetical protein MHU86_24014 [Fragilaria crotonensis]
MRDHLEIFSLNHAPSQTEEAIARMRVELDAIDAKHRGPSTTSAQTRSTFVEMRIGDPMNALNAHRKLQPQKALDNWIPLTGQSNACSSTSIGSGSSSSGIRIQPNANSPAVQNAGRRKIGKGIVRRLLRSVSPRRPPNNTGNSTLLPNQHHGDDDDDDDDAARRDTDPTQTHRGLLRVCRRSMSFENGHPLRERGKDRRNSVDQKMFSASFCAEDAAKEMERIQQQLERGMDRLHLKWDDLQRKRRLLRSGVSFNEFS